MSTKETRALGLRGCAKSQSLYPVHSIDTVTMDTGDKLPPGQRWMHAAVHCCNTTYSSMIQSRCCQSYSRQVAVSHLAVPSRLQVASQSYFSAVSHISLRDW